MTPNLLRYIELIYEGVIDDSHWRRLLAELKSQLKATTACLIVDFNGGGGINPDHASPHLLYDGGVPDSVEHYMTSLYALDPFVNLPDGEVVAVDEVAESEAWRDETFYRMCLEPAGLRFFLGLDCSLEDQTLLRIRVGRSVEQGAFSAGDKAHLAALAPHLRRAIAIRSMLGFSELQLQSHREVLDRMASGMMVIDRFCKLIDINTQAKTLLSKHDGIGLRNGRLCMRSSAQQSAFEAAIESQLNKLKADVPGTASYFRIDGSVANAALGIALKPVRIAGRHLLPGDSDALHFAVHLSPFKNELSSNTSALQSLFGLTPMESRLSLLLANGHSIESATQELGIKPNTGRAHLRAVFQKIGVSRQSQLVSIVLNSVAAV